MLIAIAIILLAATALLLVVRPYHGFLLVIISKPIIDMTWDFRPGGFSLIQMLSAILPILLLPRLMQSRFWHNPRNKPWILIGGLVFVGQFFPSIVIFLQDTIAGVDAVFRSLNVFLAFLMIPAFATNDERLRQILIAFIIAGIAPLLISLYGDLTGTVWRSRVTVGLERNIGLYHNGVSIRHFGLQSVLVAIMYLSLFPPRRLLLKLALFAYALLCLYMLYKGYTRGGVVTVGAWALIWTLVYRKIGWGIMFAMAGLAVEFVTGGRLSEEVLQLFSKEVTFYEGGFADSSRVMNGRVGLWKEDIRLWQEQQLIYKIFGGNSSGLGSHNEVLRALVGTGLIGLACYLIGIIMISLWGVRNFFSRRTSKYGIFCVMILAMYYLEALGSTPGAFPQYLWFVYGFLGTFILNSHRYSHSVIARRRPRRNVARPYQPVRDY